MLGYVCCALVRPRKTNQRQGIKTKKTTNSLPGSQDTQRAKRGRSKSSYSSDHSYLGHWPHDNVSGVVEPGLNILRTGTKTAIIRYVLLYNGTSQTLHYT